MVIPADMQIIHQDDFHASAYQGWNDTVYFRLFHSLNCVFAPFCRNITFSSIALEDVDFLVRHINTCYQDLHVSREQMLSYLKTPVYRPELWIVAKDASSSAVLGSGIADYDAEAKELILEWIQVLPEHRRKGVGSAIVNELLCRKPVEARFATVSGKADSVDRPESLYRKCGFTGQDYWHILRK